MPALVTLVIFLSATDAADPSTRLLVPAAQEILRNAARVTLRETRDDIGDDELASLLLDADAVANIAWLGSDHRHAQVRCYLAKPPRLIKREIAFDEGSAPTERERMLGFVVASMLPPAPDQTIPAVSLATPSAKMQVIEQPAALAPASTARFVGMVEVTGLGATGVNGSGSTFGASVAARWLFGRKLALRVAFGLRRGDIPAASATSELDFLGVGLAFESPVAEGSRFAIGGRAGGLVLREVVTHLDADEREPDSRSRFVPGVDAFLEGAWDFATGAGLVAGIGSELSLGRTEVLVKGKETAVIPWLRLGAELGVQARF